MDLKELGWNEHFKDSFNILNNLNNKELFPARVATSQREIYSVLSELGEHRAEMSGKIRLKGDFPVVGDWVLARLSPEGNLAIIEGLIPRIAKFSRKVPGKITEEQVLVANIDIAFLVNGLDGDYNLRRIERYLTLVKDSNVTPVILLNKTDMCPDVKEKIAEVESIALGTPIHTLSALNNEGISSLKKYIDKGVSVAFLGSSGAGKSTIINCLLGEERLKVGSVSKWESRGKHTTTYRELIVLPEGGIVIDNPGLREIQVWADENALETSFNDIKELAVKCRFTDCSHTNEPECAVRDSIEKGDLDSSRFRNFVKMKKEIRYLATRKEKVKSRNAKIVWEKEVSKLSKQIKKHKNKYE
jgi:ribosome biogenesis GTPase